MPLLAERDGRITEENSRQDRILAAVYRRQVGRCLLRPFLAPCVSRLAGRLLDSRVSARLAGPFIRANRLDMRDFENRRWRSFNDFFTRQLAPGARPIDPAPQAFVSPCDGRLSVWPIDGRRAFAIKQTAYTLDLLLKDRALARRFAGGWVWIFRLTPADYHRYIWPQDGTPGPVVRLPGILHTVNPAATDTVPVYKENCREYCLLHSARFGDMVQMEVGALLVGRIVNLPTDGRPVHRGEEKGYFAFGGSTIVLLTGPGAATPDADILRNTQLGAETRVRLGERVGGAD